MNTTANSMISLCMIVKNEAAVLDDCLARISPWVHEIVVVDTGSSDGTAAVAQQHGAQVLPFDWNNNFSEARNFSIRHARHPWILVMDADEKLAIRDAKRLRVLLQARLDGRSAPAFSFIQRNYLRGSGQLTWDQSWKANTHEYEEGQDYPGYLDVPVVRLFPRDPRIEFGGWVHESVEASLGQAGIAVEPSGLVLHHFGQVRDKDRMRQKKALYLDLGRQKLKQEPRSARAYFELGIQHQELENFAEAIPCFEVAKGLDARFAVADLYLGICHSRLGNYAEAMAHLERARVAAPESVELECELGIVALRTGQLASGAACFEQALSREPKHVASLCYLGALRIAQGRAGEGIALLEQALQIDPEHRDSWVNLGLEWQKAGEHEKAGRCFENAHELKPEDAEMTLMLARSLLQAGNYEKASKLLEKAASQWPDNWTLQSYRAAVLTACGEEQKALAVYQSILDRGGNLAQLASQQIGKLKLRNPCLA
jgi:tetratricopeptide (TPR) repeat protein